MPPLGAHHSTSGQDDPQVNREGFLLCSQAQAMPLLPAQLLKAHRFPSAAAFNILASLSITIPEKRLDNSRINLLFCRSLTSAFS